MMSGNKWSPCQDDKKIKECGEEIADAASDNEPYFEPEQVVQMRLVAKVEVPDGSGRLVDLQRLAACDLKPLSRRGCPPGLMRA